MVIYHYPLKEKTDTKGAVLALGFFDGVHIAHRDLIKTARAVADERGLKLGVFTFGSGGNIKLSSARLYADDDKAEIFESLGADFTVIADFGSIAGMSGEEFVKDLLVGELGASVCVAGFNFRFGRGASSGEGELRRYMSEAGGEAIIREEITTGDHLTLSATLIRDLIKGGEIKRANEILGAPYYIKGRVLHGRAVGRGMGFPTVNIPIPEGHLVPLAGVYRSAVVLGGDIYPAITNIGRCPTFGEHELHLESYILDYSGDLYEKELRVYLLDFIREERTFGSAEELKAQIAYDTERVRKESGDLSWQHLGLK
jgi:riboflavin kinase/FMN adenylyltransferase